MTIHRGLLALLVLMGGLTGCSWEEEQSWELAVLSGSGEELVLARMRYEAKAEFARDAIRNRRFELWTASFSDPEDRTRLGEDIEGQVRDLFYLHAQGHVIVSAYLTEDEDQDDARHIVWYAIDLEGVRTQLGEADQQSPPWEINARQTALEGVPLQYLPDPTGERIARVDGTRAGQLDIDLLDGVSLESSGTARTLSVSGDGLDVAWLEDGRLALDVQSGGSQRYFTMVPGAAPEPADPIDRNCFSPPTRSSSWTAEGLHVHVVPEGELVLEDDAGFEHFGCHEERR